MCSRKDKIKSILNVIDYELVDYNDEKMSIKSHGDDIIEIDHNNNYYSKDGKCYLKCNFINNKNSTIVVTNYDNNHDISIRWSDGSTSSNVCFTLRKDDCEISILFGKEKNGENYFKVSKKVNSDIGYVIYRNLNDNKSLSIYESSNNFEKNILLTQTNFKSDIKCSGVSTKVFDNSIDFNDFDDIAAVNIKEREEIIIPILCMFKTYANDIYNICIKEYAGIIEFEKLLSKSSLLDKNVSDDDIKLILKKDYK